MVFFQLKRVVWVNWLSMYGRLGSVCRIEQSGVVELGLIEIGDTGYSILITPYFAYKGIEFRVECLKPNARSDLVFTDLQFEPEATSKQPVSVIQHPVASMH
jgi:hypothetical protein